MISFCIVIGLVILFGNCAVALVVADYLAKQGDGFGTQLVVSSLIMGQAMLLGGLLAKNLLY